MSKKKSIGHANLTFFIIGMIIAAIAITTTLAAIGAAIVQKVMPQDEVI